MEILRIHPIAYNSVLFGQMSKYKLGRIVKNINTICFWKGKYFSPWARWPNHVGQLLNPNGNNLKLGLLEISLSFSSALDYLINDIIQSEECFSTSYSFLVSVLHQDDLGLILGKVFLRHGCFSFRQKKHNVN